MQHIKCKFQSVKSINPSFQNCLRQFRTLVPTFLLAYVPTLVVVGGITIFALATGKRVWYFTNDPFVLGHLPFYAGVLSSLATLVWGAGATICFFCFGVLPEGQPMRLLRRFLFVSGLLTSLYLFDDLFQFHRILYIQYLHLPPRVLYAVYGLLALGYLIYFRREIAETDYLLLGAALAFFVAAVVFDTASLLPRGRTAFSDGLKFLGIVNWTAYFARTGRKVLRRAL